MKKYIIVSFVCIAMFNCTTMLADDWPQWRGPNRDGISVEKGILEHWPEGGPKKLWQIELTGFAYSSPSVADKTVYVTGNVGDKQNLTEVLYALDPANGNVRWQTELGPAFTDSYAYARTTPTVLQDKIYAITSLGRVVCLDAKTGKIVWHVDSSRFGGRNITWGIAESPLIYDQKIICHPGGADAAVAALDIRTGNTVWTTKGFGDKSAYCSPALLTVNGAKQLVTQTENNAVGINPGNGAVLWKFKHRNQHAVHPNTPLVVDGNKIFISSGYGYGAELLEINGENVSRLWQNKSADNHFQGFMLYKDMLLCPNGKLHAINPKTGVSIYTVNETRKPQIVMTSQGLICYDQGGTVYLIDMQPEGYSIKGRFKIDFGSGEHWSTPTLANGTLYVRHGKVLAAYDLRSNP